VLWMGTAQALWVCRSCPAAVVLPRWPLPPHDTVTQRCTAGAFSLLQCPPSMHPASISCHAAGCVVINPHLRPHNANCLMFPAGDAISSTVAPPFSTTVSSNVWAMYCNRSATSCLNLNNVTLVVPTQEELNYQVFMYTMFNSPAPALRDLTDFYRTELSTSVIQVCMAPWL
jgi:hypothetical protein